MRYKFFSLEPRLVFDVDWSFIDEAWQLPVIEVAPSQNPEPPQEEIFASSPTPYEDLFSQTFTPELTEPPLSPEPPSITSSLGVSHQSGILDTVGTTKVSAITSSLRTSVSECGNPDLPLSLEPNLEEEALILSSDTAAIQPDSLYDTYTLTATLPALKTVPREVSFQQEKEAPPLTITSPGKTEPLSYETPYPLEHNQISVDIQLPKTTPIKTATETKLTIYLHEDETKPPTPHTLQLTIGAPLTSPIPDIILKEEPFIVTLPPDPFAEERGMPNLIAAPELPLPPMPDLAFQEEPFIVTLPPDPFAEERDAPQLIATRETAIPPIQTPPTPPLQLTSTAPSPPSIGYVEPTLIPPPIPTHLLDITAAIIDMPPRIEIAPTLIPISQPLDDTIFLDMFLDLVYLRLSHEVETDLESPHLFAAYIHSMRPGT